MSKKVRLALLNILAMFALVGATGLILHAPARDRVSASPIHDTHQACQVLPNYLLDVVDRPAGRDGYLVVCFGNPLIRGPLMDVRIER